jgi:hypothetical protein
MSTEFIPFVSYLLSALAVAGVLVIGLLAAVVTESVVATRRTTTQRDQVRASLATALGRVSHQN